MNQSMQFELYSHDYVFEVPPVFLLQCLRIAQEYGHTPSLGAVWWQRVQRDWPDLMLALDAMENLEYSNEVNRVECDDFVLFQLTDGQHHCEVDMMTLLTALHVLERRNIVPSIERAWWEAVLNHYELFEEIS